MKRAVVLVAGSLVALAAVGLAVAGLNRNYSVHATGEFEVPARPSAGQGQAIFHVSKDGDSVEYRLIASNIDNVIMAHIHMQRPGFNGQIVVWLFPSVTARAPIAGGGGRHDGVLATGTFGASDLTGPLAGHPLSDLITALNTGNAYVNVHTNDGNATPNEGPGDFPGGEIRGNFDVEIQ
jgi:hypothetical protein